MSVIDTVIRELLDKTEFVAIVTQGLDRPHVVGNWGDYVRKLGIEGDRIVLPAGYYRETEDNLLRNNQVQVLAASRQVAGSHGPGQGALLEGTASVLTEGPDAERAKSMFPWARGALVIEVASAKVQL